MTTKYYANNTVAVELPEGHYTYRAHATTVVELPEKCYLTCSHKWKVDEEYYNKNIYFLDKITRFPAICSCCGEKKLFEQAAWLEYVKAI